MRICEARMQHSLVAWLSKPELSPNVVILYSHFSTPNGLPALQEGPGNKPVKKGRRIGVSSFAFSSDH